MTAKASGTKNTESECENQCARRTKSDSPGWSVGGWMGTCEMVHRSLPFSFLKTSASKSGWVSVVSRWRTEGGPGSSSSSGSDSGSTFVLAPDIKSASLLTLYPLPSVRGLRVRPHAHLGSGRRLLPPAQVNQHHGETSVTTVVDDCILRHRRHREREFPDLAFSKLLGLWKSSCCFTAICWLSSLAGSANMNDKCGGSPNPSQTFKCTGGSWRQTLFNLAH